MAFSGHESFLFCFFNPRKKVFVKCQEVLGLWLDASRNSGPHLILAFHSRVAFGTHPWLSGIVQAMNNKLRDANVWVHTTC